VTAAELLEWDDPEIAALEAELAAVGEDLAGAEAALAEARELLRAFTRAHDRILGPLYAELDEVEARIAEACAAASGRPDDRRDAQAARDKANESARAAGAVPQAEAGPPPPEARPLYRGLARRCHPDLADGEADRQRRQAFMIRVNEAYAQGDVGLLTRLSREWEETEAATPARDAGTRSGVEGGWNLVRRLHPPRNTGRGAHPGRPRREAVRIVDGNVRLATWAAPSSP
jgi:hypothetical protein